ncbi:Autolysin sensor kinase [hydrothermal vent metagenome]|uniref:Autolysin sensor kinase n=1 Tax=hydrothermal vent metagenome TaxID=652676 RepID=A0A3B1CMR9_9ZZZZ
MENPFIYNRKILASFLSVLIILGAANFAVLYFFNGIELQYGIVDSLVSIFFIFIFSTSLWYPVNYMSIENHSITTLVTNHLIVAAVTSLLWVYSSYFIITGIFIDYQTFIESTLIFRLVIGLLLFIIIIILDYVIIYYDNFKTKLMQEAELSSLVKEAELKSLKYQINPHFIFNSLNSISSLTISDPEKAREMSVNLSNFLRKTLTENEKQKITLKDEIDNIKLYLEIEKVRFDERLEFIINVDENCENYKIPNMILQPIVENAIKHGVYESVEKVTINFTCALMNNFIAITITNNFDPASVSEIGEGIGLKNIRDRLKLIYSKADLISISRDSNIFKVSLKIPIDAGA